MTTSQKPETPVRSGTALGNSVGFDYFRYRHQAADQAEQNIFKITQWNYLAFSALGLVSSTGLIVSSFDRSILIAFIGFLMACIALSASIVAYLYFKYSVVAYKISWMIEKAWLRNKDGRVFVDETLRGSDITREYHEAGMFRLTRSELSRFFQNTFVAANLIPFIAGIGLIAASHSNAFRQPAQKDAPIESARPK